MALLIFTEDAKNVPISDLTVMDSIFHFML